MAWRQQSGPTGAVPQSNDETVVVSGSVELTGSNAMEWMIEGRPGEEALKIARARNARVQPAQPFTGRNRSGLFTTGTSRKRVPLDIVPAERAPAETAPLDAAPLALFPANLPETDALLPAARALRSPVILPRSQVQYIQSVKRYRTLCVRSCDGYYWPISAGTTQDKLASDAAQCKSSCSAPATLYYQDSADEDPQSLVNLQGQRYSDLSTAFAYRTALNASCKCRPEAWEQASLDRHKQYAVLAATGKTKVAAVRRPNKTIQVRRVATLTVRSQRRTIAYNGAGGTVIRILPRKRPVSRRPAPELSTFGAAGFVSSAASPDNSKPLQPAKRRGNASFVPSALPRWMQ